MAGKILGHYRLISLLGKGGMGHVYLGEDITLRRKVAIKLLPEELTLDRERLQRLKREARAASALNHPNIITIYEIGQIEQTPCLVTEYIEGETLRSRLDRGPLSTGEALDRAIQITGALQAAHAAGITHRDIKPENVIVRPDGLLKVVDFGLAKLATPKTGTETTHAPDVETAAGILLGTVSYMSPEHARGLPVDHRSDIFSFGVMLYELLTGKRPFTGETAIDVIAGIIRSEPVSVADLKANQPAELVETIGRMLAKNPADRQQSASEVQSELQSIARSTAEAEEPTRKLPLHDKASLRKSYKWAYLVAGCALLSALVAGLLILPGHTRSSDKRIHSLVVLPFNNGSADPNAEYLGDGSLRA
jgi:serine/threonine protein kinase